jgi:hypothetical protein
MPKIVVRDALHPDLRRGVGHAILALEHSHHCRGRRFIGARRSEFREHLFKFRNHRHVACLAILRGGFGVAADVKLAASKVCIGPRHVFCLADPHAAVREKANEVRAILRLACASSSNFLNEFQELIT